MKAKELAVNAAKFNALESLARTDDMLAIIGVIMLLGVIVTSYGAYWQGKVAHAQYNNNCGCTKDEATAEADKYRTYKIIGAGLLLIAIVTALCIYFSKRGRNQAIEAITE